MSIQSLLTLTIEVIFNLSIAFLTLQFVTGAFLIFVTIRVPIITQESFNTSFTEEFTTPLTEIITSTQKVEKLLDPGKLDKKTDDISAVISTKVKKSDTKTRPINTKKQKKNDNTSTLKVPHEPPKSLKIA